MKTTFANFYKPAQHWFNKIFVQIKKNPVFEEPKFTILKSMWYSGNESLSGVILD